MGGISNPECWSESATVGPAKPGRGRGGGVQGSVEFGEAAYWRGCMVGNRPAVVSSRHRVVGHRSLPPRPGDQTQRSDTSNDGFTLIELLIVVGVMPLLIGAIAVGPSRCSRCRPACRTASPIPATRSWFAQFPNGRPGRVAGSPPRVRRPVAWHPAGRAFRCSASSSEMVRRSPTPPPPPPAEKATSSRGRLQRRQRAELVSVGSRHADILAHGVAGDDPVPERVHGAGVRAGATEQCLRLHPELGVDPGHHTGQFQRDHSEHITPTTRSAYRPQGTTL